MIVNGKRVEEKKAKGTSKYVPRDQVESDSRELMLEHGFKHAQVGSKGVPRDGGVRAIVSLSRIGMFRAHWDGSVDEPLRYIDLRCGFPAWSKPHFEACKEALGRAMAEIKAIVDDERSQYVKPETKTRVSGAFEESRRMGKDLPS